MSEFIELSTARPNLLLVVGAPRSGTTVMRDVLGTSPSVRTVPFEWRLLSDPGGLSDFWRRTQPSCSPFVYTDAVTRLERLLSQLERRGRLAILGGRPDSPGNGKDPALISGAMLRKARSWAGARFLQPFKPDYYAVGLSEVTSHFPILASQLVQALKNEPYSASWIGSRRFATHFTPLEHDRAVHHVSTFVQEMLTGATRESGAAWVVDDTPYNLCELQSITQWAQCRVVFMRRNLDDLAASLQKMSWAPDDLSVCRRHAQMYADQWDSVKDMLAPGRYIEVDLSELRQHPDATLDRVACRLGISDGFDTSRINQDRPPDAQRDLLR